jgi:type I restriction enzyme S subunit
MLKVDLSSLPLLRRTDAESSRLSYLRLSPQTTLISCSGTIGRMVYARADMDGIWSSQHIMKVVPDPELVPPGFLYAYLSSEFGVPLVVSGTYGSIIQSIEPQHIEDLPVPRLGTEIEGAAHELVERAARLRSSAGLVREAVLERVTNLLEWTPQDSAGLWTATSSSLLQRRMDSFHHAEGVGAARDCFAAKASGTLGEFVEEVFEPNRGARRKVDDPAFGVPFLSSSEVFRLDPVGDYYISKTRTPHIERQLVQDNDVLLPRSGQLGGIIGRAVLPLPTYYGAAASEHLVRVRSSSREDAFFVWALLATQPGYYAAIGTAFGSSIPSLDCQLLAELRMPWWSDSERAGIVEQVSQMVESLAEAIRAEREAVRVVEQAIKEAS